MQVNLATPGRTEEYIFVSSVGITPSVVKNKNTGQSFQVCGATSQHIELSPILGREVLVPYKDFNSETWEIIH